MYILWTEATLVCMANIDYCGKPVGRLFSGQITSKQAVTSLVMLGHALTCHVATVWYAGGFQQ